MSRNTPPWIVHCTYPTRAPSRMLGRGGTIGAARLLESRLFVDVLGFVVFVRAHIGWMKFVIPSYEVSSSLPLSGHVS